MFGKRYFAIRERLAEVVLGVGQLARECGGEILDPVTDGSFLKELRKPFLFVVCGEVNAGKSALINALFGKEICEVDALPKRHPSPIPSITEVAVSVFREPVA